MRRRLLVVAVMATALVLAGAGARAEAHALLASSVPPAGALVDAPPQSVTLTFTEAPDPALTVVHVLDSRGAPVERGKPRSVAGQRESVSVDLTAIDKGVYTVTWRTTSSVDGHTTGGSLSFGVGVAPSSQAARSGTPTTPRPSPLSVFGRWAFYAGLVTLVGAGSTALVVTRRPPAGGRWPLLLAGLATAGLTAMAFDLKNKAGVSFSTLFTTTTGHKLAYQAGAVALVLAGAAFASARPRRGSVLALSAAAALAMLARAAAGHAGAASPAWLAIAVQTVHLVGVGVWVGGFVWLAAALRAAPPGERLVLGRRFSRLAAWALLVVVASGTVRALDEVGAWSRLFNTSFGQTLTVKVVLVAVIVALGAVNRFRHLAPGSDEQRARRVMRVVAVEATFGAAVLVATAILAGLPPSASVAVSSAATSQRTVRGSDYATSVRARLVVTPGTIGYNRFDVELRDYDHPRPVDATAVSLRFQAADRADVPPATLELRTAGPGRWRGEGTVLAFPGRWRLTLVVERPSGGVTVPLTLRIPEPPQQISAVRTPGLPTIYTITTSTGQTIQGYVDPGKPGANEVHVTFLAPGGEELPTADAVVEAGPEGGRRAPLTIRRLGPGHFVGDATLRPGTWVFAFRGTANDGAVVAGTFPETIRR